MQCFKQSLCFIRQAPAFKVFAGRSHYGRFPTSPLCLPDPAPPWLAEARKAVARQPLPLSEQLSRLGGYASLQSKQSDASGGKAGLEDKGLDQTPYRQYAEDSKQHSTLWAITARNDDFDGAFEVEARAQGYQELRPNVFAVGGSDAGVVQQGVWRRMVGLRLIMEPLVVAATPAELVSRTMDLSLDLVQTEFSISHERLERNEGAKELSQVALRRHLGAVLGNPNWAACKDEPGLTRPRYVVLEMTEGYVLGYVVFAPPLLGLDYSSAPQTWSAALPPELAAVAVNLVARPGDTLIDPCCGSGTIPFEAHRRGVHARGSDVNPTVLKMAAANFRHLGVPYRASWDERPSSGADASGKKRQRLSESKKRLENGGSPHGCVSSNGNGPHARLEEGPHEERSHTRSNVPDTSDREGDLNRTNLSREPNLASRQWEEKERTHAIELSIRDALQLDATADCLVANLPYNRFLEVSEGDIEELVRRLRDCAERFVFFAGAPLRAKLEKEGYEVVTEVDIGRRGKRYMSWARSKQCSSTNLEGAQRMQSTTYV
ncbi:hypothetical protein KFL_000150130 [Klebsormidium nitens]|uniref:Ribosomal RNA large subunit methyltransferase K/L-like methyltransferase domain-containing protein n=1 Tax=Klebsormidium nitens TaxID=105231 RepID=A0A1Y1HNJ7_KLENI|nr:hypothetical protein KFL_000150130 [Klebsormidium nitens]|eukprot:GAQ78561.1 hypothetical protein KFL_000150130 [Klebsormidium nitens]